MGARHTKANTNTKANTKANNNTKAAKADHI